MTYVDERVAAQAVSGPATTFSTSSAVTETGAGPDFLAAETKQRFDHRKPRSALPPATPLRPPREMRIATAAAVVYIAGLPLLRPSGPFNTSPVDLAGLLLAVTVGLGWLTRQLRLRLPFAVPVAIFALGGTLGALAGPVPGVGVTAVSQDVVLLIVCGCITTIGRTFAIQGILLRSWAIAGLCWASLLVFGVATHITALSGGGVRYGARASLTTGDPNLAGNYLVVSLFMLYAARWPRRRGRRALATLVIVVAALLTGSNGATVAIALGALVGGVAALCMKKGWRICAGLTALVAALALFFGVAPVSRWQHDIVTNAQASSIPIVRDSFGREDQSSSTRHTLLDESLELLRADGVLGTGPGSTKPLLEARQYPYQKEAHDDYLAALTERGALGALGLALLIGAVICRLSALTRGRLRGGGLRVIASGPMVGCAVALAASGLFYEVLHFRQLWVFLALLASVSAERSR